MKGRCIVEIINVHVVQLVGYLNRDPFRQIYLGALRGVPLSEDEDVADLAVLQFDPRSNTWRKHSLTDVRLCGERVAFEIPTWWCEGAQSLSVFSDKNNHAQQWNFVTGATPERKEGLSGTLAPGVGHHAIDLLRRHKPYRGQ